MFFANKEKFWLNSSIYLNDNSILSAELSKIIINDYVLPEDCSSTALSNYVLFKKTFSEYYERRILGFNSFKKGITWCLAKDSVITVNRADIGYGYNLNYGFLDTTGTAAGVDFLKMKEKSLSELIEKNESLIFWYTNKALLIDHTPFVTSAIKKVGLSNISVHLFYSNELSSMHTVIALCFYKNTFLASGMECSLNFIDSLYGSLYEAKMILNVYYGRNIYPIKQLKDKQYQICIYKFINNKINNAKILKNIPTTNKKIILSSWIDDIIYVGLDITNFQGVRGIRCLSKKLLNCVPYTKYIKEMPEKAILKKYNILPKLRTVPAYPLF